MLAFALNAHACVAFNSFESARCCHNNMTAARHYGPSVVLVEHHAPLGHLRRMEHTPVGSFRAAWNPRGSFSTRRTVQSTRFCTLGLNISTSDECSSRPNVVLGSMTRVPLSIYPPKDNKGLNCCLY